MNLFSSLYFSPKWISFECCAWMLHVQTTNLDHLLPLTTICDKIWLHRGWHAPCELPRTRSSSSLAIGLWIQPQINLFEDNKLTCTLPYLKKENKCTCSRWILFMCNPKLTDFFNVLGDIKLPPEPFK
jgi:hypothetical protein